MSSSPNASSRRILVVDDEADVLEFLRIYLESLEWDVATATSADEALRLIEDEPFFLIITDIAMPDMDGYEFMSKVRELKLATQMAVMTGFGYNPEHTLVKVNKTMHCPFLFKPFNREKLKETVQDAWEAYQRALAAPDAPLPSP
jgi:DNA-binding NtrC family response regulator